MKDHPLEDRLRDALAARAETFSASPDAWLHVQEKDARLSRKPRGRSGLSRGGWLARHSAFVIPAAAAATVVAVALSAAALAHGFSGTAGHRAAVHPATGKPARTGWSMTVENSRTFADDPPVSALFHLKVTRDITAWNWIGQPSLSQHNWFPYIGTRPEACVWVYQGGAAISNCWPVPTVDAAHPAAVISNSLQAQNVTPVIYGLAEPAVTSVTAVLRNGQHVHAAIGTGRGFAFKAWAVQSPAAGTTLVFAGADGQVITRLTTAAPASPDVPQPRQGGIELFSYTAGQPAEVFPAGSVTAYLVDGHVAFYPSSQRAWGAAFSPSAASAPPAVDGMAWAYASVCRPGCKLTLAEAFGYAHGNVAYVEVRLPDGKMVTTPTFAAWPGSGLRLWRVSLPARSWGPGPPKPTYTATAYNAAGHSVGHVQLGQPGT